MRQSIKQRTHAAVDHPGANDVGCHSRSPRVETSLDITRRVSGGVGNELGRRLLDHPELSTPRQLRDHAMLAMLIGCGLRRGELLALRLESV
jgi:site-specific recombinase XerC